MGDVIPFPIRPRATSDGSLAHPSSRTWVPAPRTESPPPADYVENVEDIAAVTEDEARMEALFVRFPDDEAHLVAAGLYFDDDGNPHTTYTR